MKRLSLLAMVLTLVFSMMGLGLSKEVKAASTTYYVDSTSGSDTNAGTSTGAAWKTLAKVNGVTFQQGDRILFKAGGVWNGQLYPKGSGVSGSPIQIDQYGTGSKPIINGGGNTQGAVYLYNQQYWEIRNLEVTNTGTTRDQYVGIRVVNETAGLLSHIYVGSNVVHDVNGVTAGFYGTNGGITVTAKMDGSYWNDVVIENNNIYVVDRVGIFVGPSWQEGGPPDWLLETKSTNITIQNNTIRDSGGDGILNFITSNVMVQNNVVYDSGARANSSDPNTTGYSNKASVGIWNAISDYTTFQFNEVYNEKATLDGEGFDVDLGTNHTTVQYNYSHDNAGGFILICESATTADINDAKVRYNISQNDQKGIFHIGQPGFPPGADKTDINNNTIYIAKGDTVPMFRPYGTTTIPDTAYVYNNIFYVAGTTSYPTMPSAVFDYNIFYGNHPTGEPADAHKLTTDPGLVGPASGAIGLTSVDGYKLRAGSPALASGTYTSAASMGTSDYWGNAVSSGAVNRGAYNGAGISGVPVNYALNSTVTSSSAYEASSWSKLHVVDGQRLSILGTSGFTSQVGLTTNHTEWIELDLGATAKTFSKVILYPRTGTGTAGEGFPVNFQIQVWNGSTWLTRVTKTSYPNPGSTPQTFTWGSSDTTDRIRIYATSLDNVGTDYLLQFAEIEVTP
ncbi:hypothetical protein A8709_05095 [Paenibacillus pectinilyticus]|uniref:Right handed beta helix domain-containing protein n=1 Tax=Paenibacillus pectinilyticus TaxID=512399 RepID=A0A1C0ZSL5_9BACL|nr:right-handed parallel beta-helix repeat-containing protein [Paenibacillus pectinilyticus]OCT11074.1 hypothetical protein A8709_05095 [Paenibacillus pectinilyticus]